MIPTRTRMTTIMTMRTTTRTMTVPVMTILAAMIIAMIVAAEIATITIMEMTQEAGTTAAPEGAGIAVEMIDHKTCGAQSAPQVFLPRFPTKSTFALFHKSESNFWFTL